MRLSRQGALDWASNNYPMLDSGMVADIYLQGFNYGYNEGTSNEMTRPRAYTKPSDNMIETIRKEYVQGGLSVKDLSVKYKRSVDAIRTLLKKFGIRKNFSWRSKDISYLLAHYGKDLKTSDLARHFGISEDAVTSGYRRFSK